MKGGSLPRELLFILGGGREGHHLSKPFTGGDLETGERGFFGRKRVRLCFLGVDFCSSRPLFRKCEKSATTPLQEGRGERGRETGRAIYRAEGKKGLTLSQRLGKGVGFGRGVQVLLGDLIRLRAGERKHKTLHPKVLPICMEVQLPPFLPCVHLRTPTEL